VTERAANSFTASRYVDRRLRTALGACIFRRHVLLYQILTCYFGNNGFIGKRCEMPTQILPTASLRSAKRLPAARALLRVSNRLIWMGLWSIGRVIFGVGSNFSLLSGRGALPAASSRRRPRLPDRCGTR